jgi:ribosomal protein S18 acetylase RimI-like enzyme
MKIERVDTVTEELLALCTRLMPQLTRQPAPTRAEVEDLLASDSQLFIARSASGTPVGMGTLAVFRTPSGLHAHIEDLVVDESERGKGTGEALMRALLDSARQLGLDGVSLTCNPRRESANRLYQRMGFKKWETNVYWYALK